ncbi:MAG: ribose-phosphate pyrophosphokinase [Bacteroidetes bacterium QH_7_62_13]|jgi:ribose-phosphate pyrophosphokinase|nr:MAG: ribose-phosphate pyrophosphokinase [Bacteroidetes bacterium QH_7_62_13]
MSDDLRLFAPSESADFGRAVAAALDTDLDDHHERTFADGEHELRSEVNVRGRDVFVVQSLYADPEFSVNDKLARLLFFLGSLRDAAARRVTAVVPYLCYQRKDRKSKPRDAVTTRYLGSLFAAIGVDRVLSMDVHNLAVFQNSFHTVAEHLEARPLFVQRIANHLEEDNVVVVSPDEGGVKRASRFAGGLGATLGREVPTAFVEKTRDKTEERVSGGRLVGPADGRVAVIVDDLISTGGTITQAAAACANEGAHTVVAAATHGLFSGDAPANISDSPLDALFVTNTVAPFRLEGTAAADRLMVCDAAPRFAAAIRAIHTEASVSALNKI